MMWGGGKVCFVISGLFCVQVTTADDHEEEGEEDEDEELEELEEEDVVSGSSSSDWPGRRWLRVMGLV